MITIAVLFDENFGHVHFYFNIVDLNFMVVYTLSDVVVLQDGVVNVFGC